MAPAVRRAPSASKTRVSLLFLERVLVREQEVEELADLGLLGLLSAHGALRVHLVVVATPDPLAGEVALVDELGDDALGRALGDIERRGDVAQPNCGVAGDDQEDARVIGYEGPLTDG